MIQRSSPSRRAAALVGFTSCAGASREAAASFSSRAWPSPNEARMKITAYGRTAFSQAGAAIRSAPLPPAIAVFAMALGLLLTGGIYLLARNAGALLRTWGEGVQLTIYLDPDGPPGRAAAVSESLRRVP